MRVSGSTWAGAVQGGRAGPRPTSDGFAPEAAEGPGAASATAHAASLGPMSSLDALLALQETLGPLERRKRAVRRAGRILDVLDELKLAALEGEGGGTVLVRLQSAVREARAETDDTGLEDVLEQVEVRAAVELAKRQVGL